MSKPIVYNVAKAEGQIAELKKSIEELKIGEMGYLAQIGELKAERNELKKRMEKMKYDLDFINSDRNLLKEENEKLKAENKEQLEMLDSFRNSVDSLNIALEYKEKLINVFRNNCGNLVEKEKNLIAENEKLKEENKDLRFETVRSFERGQKFPCNLNCENCTEKCRAWQNGYNAKGGNNHIVQIKHFNDYRAKMYTFNVPDGLTLKKGDYVLVETKGGTPKIAKCMTDSIKVNDEILHMIMQGNKVISSVIGRYDLKECDTE